MTNSSTKDLVNDFSYKLSEIEEDFVDSHK